MYVNIHFFRTKILYSISTLKRDLKEVFFTRIYNQFIKDVTQKYHQINKKIVHNALIEISAFNNITVIIVINGFN